MTDRQNAAISRRSHNQRRLLFWQKMITSDNIIPVMLSRVITSRFVAIGSLYGITMWSTTPSMIKLAIWKLQCGLQLLI